MIQFVLIFTSAFYFAYCVNITPHPKYAFEQCLVSNPSLGYCFGISALNKLQSIDNDPEYDIVDGVSFTRDDQQPRGIHNFLEQDPNDFGNIIDTMSNVMAYRTLRWDMGNLYPGLMMRVTPSVNGVLEFVLDSQHDDLQLLKSNYKQMGTGRILARQFLIPLLLGFKFKVATLIPILFGVLALLAKKALILSKIALIVSSSVALSSILMGPNSLLSSGYQSTPYLGGHHGSTHGFGGIGGWNGNYHHGYKTEDNLGDYSEYTKTINANTDQLPFGQITNIQQEAYDRRKPGRNFAWNVADEDTHS